MHILGIDLSLRSPGFCLFDKTLNKWSFYGFQQRDRDAFSQITLFPRIPQHRSTSDVARYSHIMHHLDSIVESIQHVEEMVVVIEGYAFNPIASGSSYKLHELGGIIKYRLSSLGVKDITVVSPTKWKSNLLGSTTNNKWVAYEHVIREVETFEDIYSTQNRPAHLPNPIQDVADATCLVLWYIKTKC